MYSSELPHLLKRYDNFLAIRLGVNVKLTRRDTFSYRHIHDINSGVLTCQKHGLDTFSLHSVTCRQNHLRNKDNLGKLRTANPVYTIEYIGLLLIAGLLYADN